MLQVASLSAHGLKACHITAEQDDENVKAGVLRGVSGCFLQMLLENKVCDNAVRECTPIIYVHLWWIGTLLKSGRLTEKMCSNYNLITNASIFIILPNV